MEKDRFLFLVQHYTSLSEAEADELIQIQKSFPFSQVIHNLAARAAQDNQLQAYDQLLKTSAVYSTDRSVLKYIMTQPKSEHIDYESAVVEPSKQQVTEARIAATPVADISSGLSGDALITELESDLKRLKKLRHNFEVSLEEFEHSHPHPVPLAEKKTKKEKTNHDSSKADHLDVLIEEIKINKKEIDPESERQKEQLQIIDKFIKTSPTISKGKIATVVATTEDLAEPSSSFGDHIISETLVDILLKQGKKDKAIEVLRKLIWKFPQKKAIFAAQIETLRK